MTTIELTDERRQALRFEQGKPVDVVDAAVKSAASEALMSALS